MLILYDDNHGTCENLSLNHGHRLADVISKKDPEINYVEIIHTRKPHCMSMLSCHEAISGLPGKKDQKQFQLT